VPIPVPGVQLVTLTHVEDVASMLASVPGSKAAIQQHYNVCSDRAITFVGEWCKGTRSKPAVLAAVQPPV
jgi:nucleoside-diphosphate-sugar epimerase